MEQAVLILAIALLIWGAAGIGRKATPVDDGATARGDAGSSPARSTPRKTFSR